MPLLYEILENLRTEWHVQTIMGRRKFFLAAALLVPGVVVACCVAYGPHPISLVDEKAIIVWNPEINMQHFIRQASFKGQAKDFGFIVPTPNRPTVEVADAKAFGKLESYVPRLTSPRGGFGGGLGGPGGRSAVQVIEQKRVGDYLATILKATDGRSLNEWLKQNGYVSRPAMGPWLDHYARQSFYFAALKFVRELGQESPETSALRISFATHVPFYPYKMPSDTWPANHFRPLALYFIGPAKASAAYLASADKWEARTDFSGPLRDNDLEPLAKQLSLKVEDFPAKPVLTAFVNTCNAQGYGRDLMFQSPKPGGGDGLAMAAAALLSVQIGFHPESR